VNYRRLIDSAKNAQNHSYSPYSTLKVGAAILTHGRKIYTGCNIENSSYGLTICAERVAIFNAVSQGERKFKAIAITGRDAEFVPPCGACRQVLFDLAGDIDIVQADRNHRVKVIKLSALLPFPFTDNSTHPHKKK
jgi:cytidine deaminase